jgi:hypothetical protein
VQKTRIKVKIITLAKRNPVAIPFLEKLSKTPDKYNPAEGFCVLLPLKSEYFYMISFQPVVDLEHIGYGLWKPHQLTVPRPRKLLIQQTHQFLAINNCENWCIFSFKEFRQQ